MAFVCCETQHHSGGPAICTNTHKHTSADVSKVLPTVCSISDDYIYMYLIYNVIYVL